MRAGDRPEFLGLELKDGRLLALMGDAMRNRIRLGAATCLAHYEIWLGMAVADKDPRLRRLYLRGADQFLDAHRALLASGASPEDRSEVREA